MRTKDGLVLLFTDGTGAVIPRADALGEDGSPREGLEPLTCSCRGLQNQPTKEHGRGLQFKVRYVPEDGGTEQGARSFRTKRDAQRWLDDQTAVRVRGEYISPDKQAVSVAELYALWFDGLTRQGASTRERYRSAWDNHVEPRWGGVSIAEVTTDDVRAWVAWLGRKDGGKGLAGSSVRQTFLVLHGTLSLAVPNRLRANPCDGVKLPRAGKKEPRFITRDDVQAMVRAADWLATERARRQTAGTRLLKLDDVIAGLPRDEHGRAILPGDGAAMRSQDGLLIDTLAATGCRWGELAGLRVKRCDLDRTSRTGNPAPRLVIAESVSEVRGHLEWSDTKTHKSRSVAVPPKLAARLRAHIDGRGPSELVFPSQSGEPLRSPLWSRRVFRPVCDVVGLDRGVTIHSMRHHYASVAMSKGGDPVRVARQLGHSSPQMTMNIYSHVSEDGLDALAGMFDD